MKFISLLKKASPTIFFSAIAVSVASGFCSTWAIRLVHMYINQGIAHTTVFAMQFVAAVIGFGLFGILSSYFISVLTQSMVFQLRTELSSKILNASYQHTENKISEILPVLTADINHISASMNRLPPVVTGLATAIGCLIYLFIISWQMTLACIALFFVAFAINYLMLPYLKKYSELARNEWDRIYVNFEGIVFGMKELKLNPNHRLNYVRSVISPGCENERNYRIKEESLYAGSARLIEILLFLGIGGFILSIHNFDWITKDVFGDYLLVLLFTIAPLATVSGFLKHIKRTQVSLDKIWHLGIDLQQEIINVPQQKLDSAWDADMTPIFEFQNVHFQYSPVNHFKIGPINLSVNKGEIIYLIGGNGSGKTTFIKLLSGLYQPTSGDIRLKGQTLPSQIDDSYRSHFAGVFTDYHLFEDLFHIAPHKLEGEAKDLLLLLELDHKVSIEGEKLSTTQLSYGQRKRLAMLISILEDKEIYIFDEWAANQDPYFKEKFYAQILPWLKTKGKTIIAISHDEKYFEYADRIIRMHEGILEEQSNLSHVYIS